MNRRITNTPAAWKNTFFWLSAILLIIGIIGLPFLGGDRAIKDPGQQPELNLYLIYLAGSIIMLINGIISHKLTIQQFLEQTKGNLN